MSGAPRGVLLWRPCRGESASLGLSANASRLQVPCTCTLMCPLPACAPPPGARWGQRGCTRDDARCTLRPRTACCLLAPPTSRRRASRLTCTLGRHSLREKQNACKYKDRARKAFCRGRASNWGAPRPAPVPEQPNHADDGLDGNSALQTGEDVLDDPEAAG
jgi:hypothetical protein